MVSVELPFKPEFQRVMLSGRKTMTSRTKRYGKRGDTFQAFGTTFKILDVSELQLDEVEKHYYEEGCCSEECFRETWEKLHPRRGFDPEQWVYTHYFEKVTEK